MKIDKWILASMVFNAREHLNAVYKSLANEAGEKPAYNQSLNQLAVEIVRLYKILDLHKVRPTT